MPKKTLFVMLLLTLLLPVFAFAEEVNTFTLDNGLTVLHMERRVSSTVSATVLLRASSLQEPQGKEGLAALTAKTIITGTKHRNYKRLIEDAANAGAMVASNCTPDYATVNVSVEKKEVRYGFDLLIDVLVDPTFTEENINWMKKTITDDMGKPKMGFALVNETLSGDIFGKHPYGRAIEGTLASISGITRDDILSFYKTYYTPKNAVLAVVGNITLDELKRIAGPYMNEWKGDLPQQPATEKAPAAAKKVTSMQRWQDMATIALGFHGVARESADYNAVSVMNYLFGGMGQASRLTKAFQNETPFYPAVSKVISMKEGGYIEAAVEVNPADVSKVVGKILGQIEEMKKSDITTEELAEAKDFLKQGLTIRMGSHKAISEILGENWLYNLGTDYLSRYGDMLDKVTKEDVLKAAKKYLDTDTYDLVLVGNKEKMDLSGIAGDKK